MLPRLYFHGCLVCVYSNDVQGHEPLKEDGSKPSPNGREQPNQHHTCAATHGAEASHLTNRNLTHVDLAI